MPQGSTSAKPLWSTIVTVRMTVEEQKGFILGAETQSTVSVHTDKNLPISTSLLPSNFEFLCRILIGQLSERTKDTVLPIGRVTLNFKRVHWSSKAASPAGGFQLKRSNSYHTSNLVLSMDLVLRQWSD